MVRMDYFDLLDKEDVNGLYIFLEKHNANEELQGYSLLYWAIFHNNVAFTKALVNQGANVNQCDHLERTPLQIACYFGFYEIAELLLQNGAHTDGCLERAKNGWGDHIQTEIIELLEQWEKE